MNIKERQAVGRIQDLVGRAIAEHRNDRNPNHIQAVEQPLTEAFNLCIEILGKYPPVFSKG